MATKSGFSRAWQGFMDHKWSKKRVGTPFAVLSNTLQRIRMRERSFPRLSKRYRHLAAIAHARIRKISVICSRVSRCRRPSHLKIRIRPLESERSIRAAEGPNSRSVRLLPNCPLKRPLHHFWHADLAGASRLRQECGLLPRS